MQINKVKIVKYKNEILFGLVPEMHVRPTVKINLLSVDSAFC